MARRVDDVDLDILVLDRRIFRHDGDAPLSLEIHRVHHPLGNLLVFPEGPRLLEHGVNQGCLSMIDMGDNGNVSYVLLAHGNVLYSLFSFMESRDHSRGRGDVQKKQSLPAGGGHFLGHIAA
jgi:hypothetical protein